MIQTKDDLKEYLAADARNYWPLTTGLKRMLHRRLVNCPISDQTKI